MTSYYCTYFDANYLIKALALFESLEQQETCEYRVFAICMDELSRVLLTRLAVPNVECVPMHAVERHDLALLAAKKDRSVVEYYWTATPSVVLWLLEQHPDIDLLTYVDADLYFYSSPQAIRDELGDGSVLIHGHNFPQEMRHLEEYGKYNVGLIAFRNDERARLVLRWWRNRCNEWCRSEPSAGRFADQKYLDEWPISFDGVHVIANPGAGVAPWNHSRYRFSRDDQDRALVDGSPIIFYHFHSLVFANPDAIVPAKLTAYPMYLEVVNVCVLPYVHALDRARLRVLDAYGEFMFPFGLYTDNVTGPNLTLVTKKTFVENLHSAGAPHEEIVLDQDWVVFPGTQIAPSGRTDANGDAH